MSWAIEYRPGGLNEFFGNRDVVKRIKKFLELGRFPKTSIFYGESGCGKTTMARIIGKELGLRVGEFNTANTRGIDTIREVVEISRYMPVTGEKGWLFIFDEAHRITMDGQEAMLKLLEGDDNWNWFVLCTTEIDGLIETIRNRGKVFYFRRLDLEECKELVRWLEKRTGRKWNDDVVFEVWRACKGVPRLIVNVLEEANNVEEVREIADRVYFSDVEKDLGELAKLVLERKASWKVVSSRIKDMDEKEIEELWRVMKSYVLKVLLNSEGKEGWVWCLRVLDLISKARDVYGFVVALGRLVIEKEEF